jgi:hypothetical protein
MTVRYRMPAGEARPGAQPTLVLTRSEHRVMAAHRRHLQHWAVIGGIASPIVYGWVAGWPPVHLLPFAVGPALVVLIYRLTVFDTLW